MGQLTEILLRTSGNNNRLINGQCQIDQVYEGGAIPTINANGTYNLIDMFQLRVANRSVYVGNWRRRAIQLSDYGEYVLAQVLGGVQAAATETVALRMNIEASLLDIFIPGLSSPYFATFRFSATVVSPASAPFSIVPVSITCPLSGRIYCTLAYPDFVQAASGGYFANYAVTFPMTCGSATKLALSDGVVGLTIEVGLSNCTGELISASSANQWVATGAGSFAPGANTNFTSSALIQSFGRFSLQLSTDNSNYAIDPVEELKRCQRYYEKSFSPGVAVAQGLGNSKGAANYISSLAGVNNQGVNVPFKVPKAIVTPVMTSYNGSAANANWRNVTLAADSGVPSFINIGANGCGIINPQVAGDAVGNTFAVQWTADARL